MALLGVVVVVTVTVTVTMGMGMGCGLPGVGARLRLEGRLAPLHHQPPMLQQVGEHRIVAEPQLGGPQLQGHMAIAQVIRGLQQGQGAGGPHQQQRLRSRLHQHQRTVVLRRQPLARAQGLTAGQLQQQGPPAEAVAPSPQAGALLGGQGQPQWRGARRPLRPGGMGEPAGKQQGGVGKILGHTRLPALFAPTIVPMFSAAPAAMSAPFTPWHGQARLRFHRQDSGSTGLQGGATAPLKLQRTSRGDDGRCELPLLHTAGGLVGGDRLSLTVTLGPGSRALLTSVAAQKVYGSIGRSRRAPEGSWAEQRLDVRVEADADLEWLPQELVLFADGLFHQGTRVDLAPGASWLGAEVVRLGRTAAGEGLGAGRWRSDLEIRRLDAAGAPASWELVDRLELGGEALAGEHGMGGAPVFGSLVWVAPAPLAPMAVERLLAEARSDRTGLVGAMACGALDQGLVARYRGPSSQAARLWFRRLWARIRAQRGLSAPTPPRVWPFQEEEEERGPVGAAGGAAAGGGPP